MLDLTNIKKPTRTIKITEDIIVNIYPTSKAMLEQMANVNHTVPAMYQLAADILSCNAEKRTITVEEINHLDLNEIAAIFTYYRDYIVNEVENNPN